MSAPATNPLETLLTEALSARAELVDAHDLTPGSPPATVTSIRRWARPAAYVAAAAAVAVAAAVVVTTGVIGDRDGDAGPAPATQTVATDSPSPAPVTPTDTDLPKTLAKEDSVTDVPVGSTATYDDGSTARIEGDEVVVTTDGTERRAPVAEHAGTSAYLWGNIQLQLGQAGVGYVVDQTDGDVGYLTVYLLDGEDGLVPAEVAGDVPFGSAPATDDRDAGNTFTTAEGSGLFTRVAVPGRRDGAQTVYRWEATGPGEGGGAGGTGDTGAARLRATRLGVFCFGFEHAVSVVTNCGQDPNGSDGPTLLDRDTSGASGPGDSHTFADGAVGELVRSGDSYVMTLVRDGQEVSATLPGSTSQVPQVDHQVLTIGDDRAYLISQEDENGSDSSRLTVLVDTGSELVPATVTGDTPLTNGFGTDQQATTYTAGRGKALYTELGPIGGDEVQVHSWTLDGTDLVSTLLGTYPAS